MALYIFCSGGLLSHAFELEGKVKGMFHGSPAVITFRIPTKAALQVWCSCSLLYFLFFAHHLALSFLFSDVCFITGGIFNSHPASWCPCRKTSSAEVGVGKFVVGISNRQIHISLSLSFSLLFTEACLFSLLFYGITFGPAKIMQAKVWIIFLFSLSLLVKSY